MTNLNYTLRFNKEPEGGYTVTCPLVPELITEGDTLQEALNNVADALAAVLEAYEDLGRPMPRSSVAGPPLSSCAPPPPVAVQGRARQAGQTQPA